MIAKIGKGGNLYGAISYNQQKIDSENGQVLLLNRIPETLDNNYSTNYLYRCFEPYLSANIRTEKPVRHISLNPDPADRVSKGQFVEMAQEYMERMGYANQPYIIFKHTDIERSHIHIVTVCVGLDGKKIPDSYDHQRSMAICQDLEERHNLIPATDKQDKVNELVFRPVDYNGGDIKSQIASVVRHLPKYYQYPNLGAYNALLSLFNITAEEVKGELNGQHKGGLVYFALNGDREKVSNPFKASLFGKHAGLETLQKHFAQPKEKMKRDTTRTILKNTIEITMHTATGEADFKKQLMEQGINTVVRRNDEGCIYGMTFIDHESRTVWNGSQLGKNLSANIFNDWWKEQAVEQRQNVGQTISTNLPATGKSVADDNEETHSFFDFLNKEQPTDDFGLIDGLGGLLPDVQDEDYEEQAFAHRMKKKKKRKGL